MSTTNDSKISIIVPIYNTSQYLHRCLISLQNQTYKNIEIICVNDGSTDDSAKILDEVGKKDSRIIAIHNKNFGVEHSRAIAIEHSTGKYIMFCDSDDEYHPQMCEKMVTTLEADCVDLVMCSAEHKGAFTEQEKKRRHKQYAKKIPISAMNRDDVLWNKIFKKEILDRTKLTFPKGTPIRRGYDSVFCFCYSLVATDVTVLADKLYTYYRREGSIQMLRKKNKLATTLDAFYSLPRILDFLQQNNLYTKNLDKFLAWYESVTNEAFKMGLPRERKKAIKLLQKFLTPIKCDITPNCSWLYSISNNNRHKIKEKFNIIDTSLSNNENTKSVNFIVSTKTLIKHFCWKIPVLGKHLKYADTLQKKLKKLQNDFNARTKLSAKYAYRMRKAEQTMRNILTDEIVRYTSFFMKGISEKSVDSKDSLIVSLTTYPPRIELAALAVFSLLRQTKKPDAIVLWLDEEQFPNKENDLPDIYNILKQMGLTIEWCNDDLKSFKKLIPSLKKYPNANILTADDDIFYPPNWISELWEAHKEHPEEIVAYRVRHLILTQGQLRPYSESKLNNSEFCTTPSFLNIPTTGGGVIFPPKSLHSEVMNIIAFKALSPNADDLWFWAMAVMANKLPHWVSSPCSDIQSLDSTQEFGDQNLARQNLYNGGNDKQIHAILDSYPEIKTKLGIKS